MNVLACEPADFAWIIDRTDCALTPGARGIKAVDASGRIRGMVAYDCWTPNAVQAHMAVDAPIVWRSLVGPAFSYPFEECAKSVILIAVTADNAKSLALVEHFGFERIASIQDGWSDGVDLVTFQMRKENCRFIRSNHRKAA